MGRGEGGAALGGVRSAPVEALRSRGRDGLPRREQDRMVEQLLEDASRREVRERAVLAGRTHADDPGRYRIRVEGVDGRSVVSGGEDHGDPRIVKGPGGDVHRIVGIEKPLRPPRTVHHLDAEPRGVVEKVVESLKDIGDEEITRGEGQDRRPGRDPPL